MLGVKGNGVNDLLISAAIIHETASSPCKQASCNSNLYATSTQSVYVPLNYLYSYIHLEHLQEMDLF